MYAITLVRDGSQITAYPDHVTVSTRHWTLDTGVKPPKFRSSRCSDAEASKDMAQAFLSFAVAHIERVRYEERTRRTDGDAPIFDGALSDWILANASEIESLAAN